LLNVSSVAARQANAINGVCSLTKLGVNGFTESLRQEIITRHVCVSVIEPGAVATELASHNRPEIQDTILWPSFTEIETLVADDIAEAIALMVTRVARRSTTSGSAPPSR
jgi:NADP-dependent 3-hydroxy acid dehydrogenase YdfG